MFAAMEVRINGGVITLVFQKVGITRERCSAQAM